MRPLLQHASRSFAAHAATVSVTPPSRHFASFVGRTPSVCARLAVQSDCRARLRAAWPESWSRRHLTGSGRWMEEEKKPLGSSDPIPMPPPTPPPSSAPSPPPSPPSPLSGLNFDDIPEHLIPPHLRPVKTPEPPKEEPVPTPDNKQPAEPGTTEPETTSNDSPGGVGQRPQNDTASSTAQKPSADKVTPVPDEHLPSHHHGQRWDFSKRFSELMDEILPKLAVVTQKVNTYTGTDYSGVAALRREIKEQEKLVKSRRLAIESAKQALDAAHAQQASSQKEVVALLERKHSWTAGDLERYMSLIRSEHLNDKAVREAKEALADAETALEESRSHLEKRERAQYHEEQIWSDTIRRNSTWVTFGLMGVNIFLLLLSLLILEPWRRRRMVKEIKNALEAQKAAMEVSPVHATAPAPASLPTAATRSASAMVTPSAVAAPAAPAKDLASIEAEIDKVVEPAAEPIIPPPTSSTSASIDESPTAGTEELAITAVPSTLPSDSTSASVSDLAGNSATAPQIPTNADADIDASAQEPIVTVEEAQSAADALLNDKMRSRLEIWQWKATNIAQDIVSERSISMRRVDYTTAMLQAAAAGAVIAAAIIAMMRPY